MVRNSNAFQCNNNKAETNKEISMEEILNSIRGVVSTDKDQPPFDEFNFTNENIDDVDEDILQLTDIYEEDKENDSYEVSEFDDLGIVNEVLKETSKSNLQDADSQDNITKISSSFSRANSNTEDKVIRGLFKSFDKKGDDESKTNKVVSESGSCLTVEQLAKDAIKPLIKKWLDENLPAMVKQVVTDEVRKIIENKN